MPDPKVSMPLFWDLDINGITVKVFGKRWTDVNYGTGTAGDGMMTAIFRTGDDVDLTCHVYHQNDGTITEKMILDKIRTDSNKLQYCNLRSCEVLYMKIPLEELEKED